MTEKPVLRFPFLFASVLLAACAGTGPAGAPPPARAIAAEAQRPVDFEAAFACWAEAKRIDAKAGKETGDIAALRREAARAYIAAADAGYYMERALPSAAERLTEAGDVDGAIAVFERMAAEGFRFVGILDHAPFAALRASPQWAVVSEAIRANAADFSRRHADPEAARIIDDDIIQFWRAYDLAAAADDRSEKIRIYRDHYFTPGSKGLRDFAFLKVGDFGAFTDFVEAHRAYYDGVRASTLSIGAAIAKIRNSYRRMRELYGEATFPDIYFVIGRHESFGTVSSAGNLIGAENLVDAGTPVETLPEGRRKVVLPASSLHQIVAHEYVHALQRVRTDTVLEAAIIEGGADFIGEMISAPYAPPRPYQAFGRDNDEAVWRAFMAEKDSRNLGRWRANNGENYGEEWAADLAYYVGFEIAKGYYAAAADKRAAIRDLLEMAEPELILEKSGYPRRYVP